MSAVADAVSPVFASAEILAATPSVAVIVASVTHDDRAEESCRYYEFIFTT
jgi:hypothetical protein